MADSVDVYGSAAQSGGQNPGRLLIVGLGNPMMADDGIGHEILRRLDERGLPQHVRLATIDDDVLSLMHLWHGEPAVWLVDAVSSGQPAGTLSVYEHQDVLGFPAWGVSVHHGSLGEGLRWLLHACPEMAMIEFRLFGIEAGIVAPGQRPSPSVCRSIGTSADEVAREIDKLASASRAPATAPDSATSS